MAKHFPINPAHPERVCWGCDRYCPADALMCGNGSLATVHPSELFGEDWMTWGIDAPKPKAFADDASQSPSEATLEGALPDPPA